ncbi:hypothetical protein NDU88_009885 [Pleurodeles waltl]|uniref:Uncharacterized protein n=1 Tax=Pleurodeles waltl TaxID=8319 RepID=A0AAV7PU39_PLEWA|nr:hypothetical protein NDU88_009885 [Pleurodeles waltl]
MVSNATSGDAPFALQGQGFAAEGAFGLVKVNKTTVSIFLNYSMMVQWRISLSLAIKKELQEEGICYTLLFPACLKIIVEMNAWFFDDPQSDSLEKHKAGNESESWIRLPLPRQKQRRRPRDGCLTKSMHSCRALERVTALNAPFTPTKLECLVRMAQP